MNLKRQGIVAIIAFVLIVIGGFAILFIIMRENNTVSSDNATYTRYIACALTIPPDARTAERIKGCWAAVERDTHNEVEHYLNSN